MRFLKKTVLPKEVRTILHSRVDRICYVIAENYSGVLMNPSLILEIRHIFLWHMAYGNDNSILAHLKGFQLVSQDGRLSPALLKVK